MSDPKTIGLPCAFIVGIHGEFPWEGFEEPCGMTRGTRKDPRSERYDVGLCPRHWRVVFGDSSLNESGGAAATDPANQRP